MATGAIQITYETEFANLAELIASTDPQSGNYVIQLYGNIFIHQKPCTESKHASLKAYQTDNQGGLHFIANISSGQKISQLSVSADGRFFGFIEKNGDHTEGYVYYLDTLDSSMDIAYSWSYKYAPNAVLFFSTNGEFTIFSPCATRMHVQPLYSPEPEQVFDAHDVSQSSQNQFISVALGMDYLIWIQPNGRLIVIDLIFGQEPQQWSSDIQLKPLNSCCVYYNNYLTHIHSKDEKESAEITVLAFNTISRTILVANQFVFQNPGTTWCVPDPDGKSITLYNTYKHCETRMSVILPEIITSFDN